METTFSMTSEAIIIGREAMIASHAILPICLIDTQPFTRTSMTALPRPRMPSTFVSNHCLTATLMAPQRWSVIPVLAALPALEIQPPGSGAMSATSAANWPSASMAACANLIAPSMIAW